MWKLLKNIWATIKNPSKLLANINNEPYFRAVITLDENQATQINVDFNSNFVYELDELYRTNPAYQRAQSNNDKMAVLLHDITSGIFLTTFPEDPDEVDPEELFQRDDLSNIPPLAIHGGKEVKQVVDLANPDENTREVRVELG